MHTDVDEGTKGGYVADGALKRHALLQVLDIFHPVIEARHLEVWAWVAARLFQLGDDVFDGDDAKLLVGKQLWLERFEHLGAAHQLGHWLARVRHDFFNHRVGFGVHARHVQRVATGAQAQEAGALLKGFGT